MIQINIDSKYDSAKDSTNAATAACKRVGSFKVDVKKKTNISRSKR